MSVYDLFSGWRFSATNITHHGRVPWREVNESLQRIHNPTYSRLAEVYAEDPLIRYPIPWYYVEHQADREDSVKGWFVAAYIDREAIDEGLAAVWSEQGVELRQVLRDLGEQPPDGACVLRTENVPQGSVEF